MPAQPRLNQRLSTLREVRPHRVLIVDDLMMPVMDGRTFVRNCFMLNLTRPIPTLLMSASPALRQHADQLRAFGVQGWIAKPFDLIRLLEVVAQLTEPAELL